MKEDNLLFTKEDASILEEIIINRRDVRGNKFLPTKISDEMISKILFAGVNAPSVGFSQPWEFVVIDDPKIKEKIKNSFNTENDKAKANFIDNKKELYSTLKLEGILEAPINIAVFYKPCEGEVLGQGSMPETGQYSVVCAIQNMWLMARTLNIGMGWVSILNEQIVKTILNAPAKNKLIAYLCLEYVDEFYKFPELETLKWEKRKNLQDAIIQNGYL